MSPGLLPTLIRQLRRPVGVDPPGDGELVRRYAALRDGEAFAELLRRHGPLVWGVCRRRLPNRADAEDAFQATFLVLTKRAAAIRRPEALGCWLYGVAHRVAGRMRGRSLLTVSDASLPSGAVPVADAATVREFLAALDEELLRLPEKLRGPLVLCFLQERTQDEAARQLGVSLSTLRRRLDAGRELLRVRLSGRGVELSAALAAAGLAVPSAVADAAADGALTGLVSANVLTVTEGVVRAMTYTKLKAWAAGVLMLAASAGGTGYFAHSGAAQTDGSGSGPGGRLERASHDLDVAQARAELIQSEAETQQAADRLKFIQQTVKKGFATAEQERQAELNLAAAKARREAAAKRLELRLGEPARVERGTETRKAAAAPPDLRRLRQEKLKVAREMLELVTQRAREGRNPFPDVYQWSKRVFELEQEVDPSPAARLLAATEHYTRMRMLQDRVQTSDDPLDRGTVRLYRLEAEAWAKEAEARRAPRPEPADEGAAAPTEVEQLRVEVMKAKAEATRERQRAEQLADRLQKLMDERDKSRPEGIHPVLPQLVPDDPAPPVPEGFKGTVRRVEGTPNDLALGREVWVELTPGLDAGLRQGAILTVRRMAGAEGKYLGTITIARVNAKDAVGRFRPANPRSVEADDLPKPGDQLAPKMD